METKSIIKSLAALAHESRLHIFRTLVIAGQEGLTPSALAEQIPIPAATMSFHLKELSNAGLLKHQREGRHLFYSVDFNHMNTLLGYLTQNCCQGKTCEIKL